MTDGNSVPPQTEHPAIWLMRRVGRFLKWTVLIVLGLVIVGGGATYAYFYWTDILPTSQVRVAVNKAGKNPCSDPNYPLFIGISNDSRYSLNSVYFRLIAKRPGRSTNLVEDYLGYSSDWITKSGDDFGACWQVPKLSDQTVDWHELEWSAEVTSAHFE